MKKLFLLLMTVVLTSAVALAQNRTISGTVMSAADDEPLPGAAVQPVGGGVGVATDVDGNFTISVPKNVTKLTVSYIGMIAQTVDITSDKLVIKLQNAANVLSDVVVTGYGQSTRQAFTGSATVVGAAEIEKTQVTNVLNALTGKVPGMQIMNTSGQPGSGPSAIRILGTSSLNASNAPLYVLDGIIFSGDITALNPNDIESMTISKDATANALYGARGANGVIFITTKKAKAGSNGTVTVDAKWGINTRATQDYNTINNPSLYYEAYYKALNNYYLSNGASAEQACVLANRNMITSEGMGLGYQVFNVPNAQMFIGLDGKINPNATMGSVVNGYYIKPDNWLDETYSSSLRQEYNVSVSNATDRSNFYLSFGYLNNKGIIENTGYERFTGRLAADSQIKPWLKVSGDMSYAHYDNNSMAADGSESSTASPLAIATQIAPIYPMYIRDAKGQIMHNEDGLTLYDYGNGENGGLRRPIFGNSNGVSQALFNTNNITGNTMAATAVIEVRLPYNFKFTSKNKVYLDEYRGQFVQNPYFGQYKPDGGRVDISHDRFLETTYQQLLNWNHTFGEHNISALFGHENSYLRTSSLDAYRTQMFSPDLHELATAVIDGTMDSSTGSYNNEGWILQAQYDYSSKYFANFSFRRDASSRFHPKHRWGNFWSLGAGWLISKENFFNVDWVNELKFKVSYGEQGNDGIGNYLYTNRYFVVNSGGQAGVTVSSTMGNPNITWEKNGVFYTGFNFSLFNYRLNGEINYFLRNTSDMLYSRPIASSGGFSNRYENFGNMRNYGIEMQLDGTIISTKDWTWGVNLNLTWFKNRITKLPESSKRNIIDGHAGVPSSGYFMGEGLPRYTWYCYDWAGVDPETGVGLYWKDAVDENGKPTRVKVDSDGNPTQYLNGTPDPDVYGGFGTSLRWKDLDFSIDFAYSIGGKVMDTNYKGYMMTPNANNLGGAFHADILKAWTPENPNSDIPRWNYGDEDISTSNRFLVSGSYLSLQNINLGYTLPRSITEKVQIAKLRVYVSADNVWLWSKRQGLDPRQSFSGATTNAYYSPIRTITGGLTLTF